MVLRYGGLYGPGTSLTSRGAQIEAVRKRQLPLVASAVGVWSFLHVADAAVAAVAALSEGAGVVDMTAGRRNWPFAGGSGPGQC